MDALSRREAFDRAVARGRGVVVHPISSSRETLGQDIPALVAEAAKEHSGKTWKVTEPLGASERYGCHPRKDFSRLENRR